MVSNHFTPPAVGYALAGSSMTGLLMSVPIFLAALMINRFIFGSPYDLSSLVGFAVLVGLGYSWLSVFLTRPLQLRQQTVLPRGLGVTIIELCSPLIVGSLVSFLLSRTLSSQQLDVPQSLGFGALAAVIGFLPDLFLSSPWAKKPRQEEIDAMNKEFKDMTLATLEEYRQEVSQRALERQARRHGDPWRQEHRQGWWKRRQDEE